MPNIPDNTNELAIQLAAATADMIARMIHTKASKSKTEPEEQKKRLEKTFQSAYKAITGKKVEPPSHYEYEHEKEEDDSARTQFTNAVAEQLLGGTLTQRGFWKTIAAWFKRIFGGKDAALFKQLNMLEKEYKTKQLEVHKKILTSHTTKLVETLNDIAKLKPKHPDRAKLRKEKLALLQESPSPRYTFNQQELNRKNFSTLSTENPMINHLRSLGIIGSLGADMASCALAVLLPEEGDRHTVSLYPTSNPQIGLQTTGQDDTLDITIRCKGLLQTFDWEDLSKKQTDGNGNSSYFEETPNLENASEITRTVKLAAKAVTDQNGNTTYKFIYKEQAWNCDALDILGLNATASAPKPEETDAPSTDIPESTSTQDEQHPPTDPITFAPNATTSSTPDEQRSEASATQDAFEVKHHVKDQNEASKFGKKASGMPLSSRQIARQKLQKSKARVQQAINNHLTPSPENSLMLLGEATRQIDKFSLEEVKCLLTWAEHTPTEGKATTTDALRDYKKILGDSLLRDTPLSELTDPQKLQRIQVTLSDLNLQITAQDSMALLRAAMKQLNAFTPTELKTLDVLAQQQLMQLINDDPKFSEKTTLGSTHENPDILFLASTIEHITCALLTRQAILSTPTEVAMGVDAAAASTHASTDLMNANELGRLIKKAAKMGVLDSTNHHGNTALHLATLSGNKNMVKQLKDAGADTTLKNKHGHTAQELSRHSSKQEKSIDIQSTQRGKPAKPNDTLDDPVSPDHP